MEKFWISLCTNPPEEGQRERRGSSSCIFLPRFHSACSVLQEFSAEERDPVKITEGWGVMFTCSPPPHYPGLSYRWLLNEFPNFIPADGRRFISQTTGNLYIAKTEASDLGNYSCFATSHIDFITKSVFSKFSRLSLAAEGQCSKTPILTGKIRINKPPQSIWAPQHPNFTLQPLLRASKTWMGWGGREAGLCPRFPVSTPSMGFLYF